jgi:hypothetical protein
VIEAKKYTSYDPIFFYLPKKITHLYYCYVINQENRMSNNQIMLSDAANGSQLDAIFAFLDPQMDPARKPHMFRLAREWVTQELSLYGKSYNTDAVECTLELQKVKAVFDCHGEDAEMLAYQLKLSIVGQEPHHPTVEVDALFIINAQGVVDNLVLSKAANLTDDEQPKLV